VDVILLTLRQGGGAVDDMTTWKPPLRSVGELLENQLRIGLVRMSEAIR